EDMEPPESDAEISGGPAHRSGGLLTGWRNDQRGYVRNPPSPCPVKCLRCCRTVWHSKADMARGAVHRARCASQARVQPPQAFLDLSGRDRAVPEDEAVSRWCAEVVV